MIKNISKYIKEKANLLIPITCFLLPMGMVSCSDFFDVDSTHIVNAEDSHLTSAQDTLYSVTGILTKLQSIADRTVLLGEARGDLVDITSATAADLRNLALFNVSDDNQYNAPVDYYAIINNCNYFLANADTTFKNNRGTAIFKTEYNAVKAIRAWTYLQLVTTYGKVPFVTTPILSEAMSDPSLYPQKDIAGVCEYFINEDGMQSIIDGFNIYDPEQYNYPSYGPIKSINSKLMFFPMRIVLGDLYLWAASTTGNQNYYLKAAKYYYEYITKRNGSGTAYPTGKNDVTFTNTSWTSGRDSWSSGFYDYNNYTTSEIISIIPTDSIPSEGHYSQLKNIFDTYPYSDSYQASLIPSEYYDDVNMAQKYLYVENNNTINAKDTMPNPSTILVDELKGDLRYMASVKTSQGTHDKTKYDVIYNAKIQSKKVNIYRRTLVYLRLAEAMNRAGYPHYAFQILSSGLDSTVVRHTVAPHYSLEDSTMLADQFGFKTSGYIINRQGKSNMIPAPTTGNMQGIHSRGCGYTPNNPTYQMPYDETIPAGTDSVAKQLAYQMEAVEDLIIQEGALETAFEGYRFYDLLRVALRRNDNNYIKNMIDRRSTTNPVSIDLTNKYNWFLHYKNQIGY